MQTQTYVEFGGRKRMNNMRHRIAGVACVLSIAMAGSALALDPEKGIVDLETNYGESGAIASVVGISGALAGSP